MNVLIKVQLVITLAVAGEETERENFYGAFESLNELADSYPLPTLVSKSIKQTALVHQYITCNLMYAKHTVAQAARPIIGDEMADRHTLRKHPTVGYG